jgi:enoyl-CoA hydratase/carnithine racemase
MYFLCTLRFLRSVLTQPAFARYDFFASSQSPSPRRNIAMVQAASVQFSEPVLLRADHKGVTTLTLNRPKQYNTLSSSLLKELQETLEAIGRDCEVRVVVIAGAGPAFCAGHDLKEMRSKSDGQSIEGLFEQCSAMMRTIIEIPQPVIARVHGIATAAGCQMVAQCDLAVASTNARFATSGINLGLFCATPGVAVARNLSRKQAFEMLFTGDFIDAATALAQGLVNRVVAPEQLDSEIEKLARAIAAKPSYQLATEVISCNMMTEEAKEGVDAFLEKRPPRWKLS